MKILTVYASLTGNTEKIARAIQAELTDLGAQVLLARVEEKPDAASFDWVAVGFWVDKGTADAKTGAYLQTLHGKKVALFATLGADPQSDHAAASLKNAAELLDDSNTVVGTFICQGKVDPALIAKMENMFPSGHPHGMDEERRARHARAASHPDAVDEAAARLAFREIKERIEKEVQQ